MLFLNIPADGEKVSLPHVVSSPDPTPKKEEEGLVTFEHFLGSCKLSILVFAHANHITAVARQFA